MPGIKVIGIDWGTSSSPGSELMPGLRSVYGESVDDVFAVWTTDVGTEWFGQFNISCSYRTVPKGVNGGFGYWTEFTWSNVQAASCHPRKTGGLWTWALNLSQVGVYDGAMSPTNTNIRKELAPNGWGFSQRLSDCIELKININGLYVSGKKDQFGKTDCGKAQSTPLTVLYVPEYTLTGVELGAGGGLDITYSVTDWQRTDDRWAIESINQGGVELASDVIEPYVTWDWVADSGLIEVPSAALVRLPEGGDPVDIDIRMNADFRGNGSSLFAKLEGTVQLVAELECNTPVITVVSADADALVLRITDSGDKGNPFDTAWVQLAGYPGGAVSCEPGGTVTIPLPPLGETLTVQAYGTTEGGATSDTTQQTVPAISGGRHDCIVIAAQDGSAVIEARYNVQESWDYAREQESYKMAGRERESVFYGVGGSATCSLKFDIGDHAVFGDKRQSVADVEALAFAGLCVYRDPDGRRRVVSVDSATPSFDTVRRVWGIDMSLREVS